MTPRDALERGVEDFAGCVPSLANVAALLVALCKEKGAHLGLLEFGSQPSALPDDLLPWFGQRRSRHRWKGQFAGHGGHQCALK